MEGNCSNTSLVLLGKQHSNLLYEMLHKDSCYVLHMNELFNTRSCTLQLKGSAHWALLCDVTR